MRVVLILALSTAFLGCSIEANENGPAVRTPSPEQPSAAALAGTVLETIDASSYTYLRLDGAGHETWVAVPKVQLELGTKVAIENPMAMSNFESKALGRTFETIYFGTLAGSGAAAAPATGKSNPHASIPGWTGGTGSAEDGADVASVPIEVAKAEGAEGRSIAELHAAKSDLSGRTVALRGKVVKYNGGIMGRNWMHLQDGSGDAAAGTNDITVTSSDTAAVGDIILVQGIVALDKDFGAGYRYDVIVEEARVK